MRKYARKNHSHSSVSQNVCNECTSAGCIVDAYISLTQGLSLHCHTSYVVLYSDMKWVQNAVICFGTILCILCIGRWLQMLQCSEESSPKVPLSGWVRVNICAPYTCQNATFVCANWVMTCTRTYLNAKLPNWCIANMQFCPGSGYAHVLHGSPIQRALKIWSWLKCKFKGSPVLQHEVAVHR